MLFEVKTLIYPHILKKKETVHGVYLQMLVMFIVGNNDFFYNIMQTHLNLSNLTDKDNLEKCICFIDLGQLSQIILSKRDYAVSD